MVRSESLHGRPAKQLLDRPLTGLGIAVAVLTACGGVAILLALPLSVLPQAQAAYMATVTGPYEPTTFTSPLGSNVALVILLAIPVHGIVGGTSLLIGRDALRSRVRSGAGLLILGLAALLSVWTFYAGVLGLAAGILLVMAGLLAYRFESIPVWSPPSRPG